MLLERFEDKGLAQYSYAVGCPASGELAIVDPRRDVDDYLAFASNNGLRIEYVLETHIHADYASGARELGERTGAPVLVSAYDAGEVFEVSFAHRDLRHGDEIGVGNVRLEAVHTPGHTPEHLSYLVYDGARSPDTPVSFLTGDFLFVGSLGRPDLLGEEAKAALASRLFDSVSQRLPGLPDGLEVLPAHGSGSMCGANIGGRATSTLGYERVANPFLDPRLDRAAFVDMILGSVPPFPDYYRRMKALNSVGAPTLDGLPGAMALAVREVARRQAEGAVIVDLRDDLSFGAGHIPGSFSIGAADDLSMWAAWLVPYDTPIVLVAPDQASATDAVRGLMRVGLDDVKGRLQGGMTAWVDAGQPTATLPQLAVLEVAEAVSAGDVRVLDVRDDGEWVRGHIAGAVHVRGGEVPDNLERLPGPDRPLAVMCQTGYRSSAVASVLLRAGLPHVANVPGGVGAWEAAGLPLEQEG